MRNPWPFSNRRRLAITALMIVGLVVSAGSGTTVYAGQVSSTRPATSPTCNPYCFETVDYGTGKCNQLGGINDTEAVVGAYQACTTSGGAPYYSFAAVPSPLETGKPDGLPVYPQANFTLESDPLCNTCNDIFLEGLDNGEKDLTGTIMVGSWPSNQLCSETTCGVSQQDDSWTSISDPNHGSSPCNGTQVLAINDAYIGVGFYEKNPKLSTGPACTHQAFEYYPTGALSGGTRTYTYVDLNPLTPGSSTPASSEATGINQQGDVVGNVTWNGSGLTHHTTGWLYVDLKYYSTLSYPTTSGSQCPAPNNTYAEGVNYDDNVVGYCTSGSKYVGFLAAGKTAKSQHPKFVYINDDANTSNYTIVRSINKNCLIAGTTKDDKGVLHGIVGYTPQGCGVTTDFERGRHVEPSPESRKS